MSHIIIDAAMPAIINSKVNYSAVKQLTQPDPQVAKASQGLEQINILLDIVKSYSDSSVNDARVMETKQQVLADEYQVHLDSLVEHLFQDLTLDGV